MSKLVKYPRKPTPVEINLYVLQRWLPKIEVWEDVQSSPVVWCGDVAERMNRRHGEIVRIVTRRGTVMESVKAFWGLNGIEKRPGE